MPQPDFLRLLPDGPVCNAVSREGVLEDSKNFTLIDFEALIAGLTREFPKGSVNDGWVLFKIGSMATFEIDPLSGIYYIKSAIGGLKEFPHGDSSEFNQIISGLRHLVRLRNKMIALDFFPIGSGADNEGQYRMTMQRPILSCNVDDIIAEIKSFRSIMESI